MWRGFPTMAHTGAARAAVDNLTKTLSVEWASQGVRVNSVAPGTIDSSGLLTCESDHIHIHLLLLLLLCCSLFLVLIKEKDDPAFRAKIKEAEKFNYAHRMGSEEEVASCIIFLLSPGASYITGETIRSLSFRPLSHVLH